MVGVAGSSKLTIIWPEKYSPEVLRMGLAFTELFRYLPQVSRGRVLELQCHGECPKMHRIRLFVSCAYFGEVGSPVQSSRPEPHEPARSHGGEGSLGYRGGNVQLAKNREYQAIGQLVSSANS